MEKQNITNTSSSSWVRGSCIGRGCFGSVHTAINKSDGEVFAVKSVDLDTCLPTQSQSLENEISVLGSLKPHPYVVKFFGESCSREGTSSFRNLHLEYLPEGDVAAAGGGIDETLLRRYTTCLVSALRHVHSQGYVHCDVKAKNVLISRSSGIKLADFGSAIKFEKPTAAAAPVKPRGSPFWMAPEVIRGEYQGPESDVWSLGCTVIEMFTGKPAWGELGFIRFGYSDELPVFPATLSESGQDFLEKCLKRDPRKRWTCSELLQHPFLSQCLAESSPRCVLDWVPYTGFEVEDEEETWRNENIPVLEIAAMEKICKLATTRGAIWESDGWVEVRCHSSEKERTTSTKYSESTRVDSEYNISVDLSPDDVADNLVIVDVSTPLSSSSEHHRSILKNYSESTKVESEYGIALDPSSDDVDGDSVMINTSPKYQGSASVPPDESVMVLHLLIEIVAYCTSVVVLFIYCCYLYQCGNNNKEVVVLSFNLSLMFFLFGCTCTCDLDRTKAWFTR